jgi:hypothetical protein
MKDKLLAVKVTEGLFPSERTVRFETEDGEVSVFVSQTQIRGDNRLRVTLLDQDSNFALVQVPSQGGVTVAKVKQGAIIADPA